MPPSPTTSSCPSLFSPGGSPTANAAPSRLVLSHAGLVRDFRQGRERLWQPEAKRLDEARLYLDTISKRWDEALARLKTSVEA